MHSQLLPLLTAPHSTPQCQLSACSKPSRCQELPGCSQEDGAHPKENKSPLPLRAEGLRTGLPEARPMTQVEATGVPSASLLGERGAGGCTVRNPAAGLGRTDRACGGKGEHHPLGSSLPWGGTGHAKARAQLPLQGTAAAQAASQHPSTGGAGQGPEKGKLCLARTSTGTDTEMENTGMSRSEGSAGTGSIPGFQSTTGHRTNWEQTGVCVCGSRKAAALRPSEQSQGQGRLQGAGRALGAALAQHPWPGPRWRLTQH